MNFFFRRPPKGTQEHKKKTLPWRLRALLTLLGVYSELLKLRVMSLVIFTAFVGMALAALHASSDLTVVPAAFSLLSIALGAGASGALNMWYDAEIDAVMTRTRNRPIPSGRLPKPHALIFGLVLSFLSVGALGFLSNWFAAGLLALTIAFYAILYTMGLKRWTSQNIVIGGAAGALPPLIGWGAVTGSLTPESLSLFLMIFIWTPPHFWALSLLTVEEYARAGIPMLPVVRGLQATRRQILFYSCALFPTALLPWAVGLAPLLYAVFAALLSCFFIAKAWALYKAQETELRRSALSLFAYSLFYLFALYTALLLEPLKILLKTGAS